MKRYKKLLSNTATMSYNVHDAECSSRKPAAWHGLFYYSVHLVAILSKTFASSDTVCFGDRSGAICRYFKVYIGQTERSVRFVYKLLLVTDPRLVCQRGYVKIGVGKCLFQSRTGLLILFLSAATYIWGIPENKYELLGYIKWNKNKNWCCLVRPPFARSTIYCYCFTHSLTGHPQLPWCCDKFVPEKGL